MLATLFKLLPLIVLAVAARTKDWNEPADEMDESRPRSPIEINEHNWKILLKHEWLVIICAKDRNDCQRLENNSHRLSASREYSTRNVAIAVVDLTRESVLLRRLSALHLPTVYHVIDGEFRRIDPRLSVESLCRLVENQEWVFINTVSSWKHPTSAWINFNVFAYKATIDLWDSGSVSTYNVAVWCIAFMFTGAWSTVAFLVYTCCFALRSNQFNRFLFR